MIDLSLHLNSSRLKFLRLDIRNRDMLNCTASTFSSRRVLYGQVRALLLMLGLLIPAQAAEALKPDALPQAQATLERLEQQLATAQTETATVLRLYG